MFRKLFILLQMFEIITANNLVTDEINCFNDFRLIELIKIRKSLDELQCDSNRNVKLDKNSELTIESRILNDNNKSEYGESLSALPLISGLGGYFNKPKDLDRSYEHQSWEDEKPSKLETVFQLSVTALSFLAFGGYLLCMIVQAIKSKGTTYYHPVATTATQTNINPLKRIKIYRRQRRTIKRKFTNVKRNSTNFNYDQMAAPNPDELYNILILFAEGYVNLTS